MFSLKGNLNYFTFLGLRGPESLSLSVIDVEVSSEAYSCFKGRSQDFSRATQKFSISPCPTPFKSTMFFRCLESLTDYIFYEMT